MKHVRVLELEFLCFGGLSLVGLREEVRDAHDFDPHVSEKDFARRLIQNRDIEREILSSIVSPVHVPACSAIEGVGGAFRGRRLQVARIPTTAIANLSFEMAGGAGRARRAIGATSEPTERPPTSLTNRKRR